MAHQLLPRVAGVRAGGDQGAEREGGGEGGSHALTVAQAHSCRRSRIVQGVMAGKRCCGHPTAGPAPGSPPSGLLGAGAAVSGVDALVSGTEALPLAGRGLGGAPVLRRFFSAGLPSVLAPTTWGGGRRGKSIGGGRKARSR